MDFKFITYVCIQTPAQHHQNEEVSENYLEYPLPPSHLPFFWPISPPAASSFSISCFLRLFSFFLFFFLQQPPDLAYACVSPRICGFLHAHASGHPICDALHPVSCAPAHQICDALHLVSCAPVRQMRTHLSTHLFVRSAALSVWSSAHLFVRICGALRLARAPADLRRSPSGLLRACSPVLRCSPSGLLRVCSSVLRRISPSALRRPLRLSVCCLLFINRNLTFRRGVFRS